MATKDDEKDPTDADAPDDLDASDRPQDESADADGESTAEDEAVEGAAGDEAEAEGEAGDEGDDEGDDVAATTTLGSARYVHAAFFAAAVLAAFVASRMLGSAWGHLTEWPAAVRAVPQLLSYSEDQRGSLTMAAGAVVGALGTFQAYRRESVRQWADDVALELSKVTWPTRETVTNGTLVVVVASIIATIYVTLLDRFWSFVTDLVYRA